MRDRLWAISKPRTLPLTWQGALWAADMDGDATNDDISGDGESHPLLETSIASLDRPSSPVRKKKAKMGFFDNLRGWDRNKKMRYLILLAISLSGDGW